MFGNGFFKNTAFLFTRWSMSKKDVNTRRKQNDTEEDKNRGFNKKLLDYGLFDTSGFPLPCFFIDNSLNDPELLEDASDEEQTAYSKAIQDIKEWLLELSPFECKDIQEVELENKKLQREKEEALNEKNRIFKELLEKTSLENEEKNRILSGGCYECPCKAYKYSIM